MGEIWKKIKGYKNYQVSNLGRVKSLGNNKYRKEKILKVGKRRGGYLFVALIKNGERKNFSVHRLVYEAFVGEIPEGMQVNHINEDKTDNRLENLNLMTRKENINWGTGIKRRSKPILQYDLEGNFIKEWKSVSIAAETLNFTGGGISNCLRNKIGTYKGYVWKYKFG